MSAPDYISPDNLTDEQKDYFAESNRRSAAIQDAYNQIRAANASLEHAMQTIRQANTGVTRCRSLSMAYTKAEEARLWLGKIEYAVAPHDAADAINADM